MFVLHKQLQKDTILVGHFPLSCLLLMQDANYPWFILVPQRHSVSEIYQLSANDQQQLSRESAHLAKVLMETYAGYKMNIAALGNVVPQLHIHHIVRYQNDVAWPSPVWGKVQAKLYTECELVERLDKLQGKLMTDFKFSR